MKPIALITDGIRGVYADDGQLVDAFARAGVVAQWARWDVPMAWRQFAAVVVRTPWDYHERFAAFSVWLDNLDGLRVPCWNPSHILRWNARKTYLLELGEEGLPVIETRELGPDGLQPHLTRWGRLVVKPVVGGGGASTWQVDAASLPEVEARLRSAGDRAFLVQPFDEGVLQGEWSLVYFDGVFSHAVHKHAPAGGFLIHEEHGGRVEPAEPPAALRAVGDRFATCRGVLPYARVDLLGSGSDARLVELELIEPELFFRFSADAQDRFARALVGRLPSLDTQAPTP